MMFQSGKTNIHKVLEDFSSINSKLKFTIEEERIVVSIFWI
jgi:hypothetical protein